ncbi:exonuclease 3'-5' domain-containing protein 2-like [Armigeres subalbatus]|uniref:exonuclease 3'-5' domain-containing protein 2-like n=1 Tax=Armigeres subalbatus TaxID=124917 RepID=UPI002ED3B087
MSKDSKEYPFQSIDFSNYKIYVAENFKSCRNFSRELQQHCEEYPVLGFDCEWWSNKGPRRKVALLQLASAGGLCLLVQLKRLSEIPQELSNLLNDPNILKVGVEPLEDGSKLRHDYGITMQGTMDLQVLAHQLKIPEPYGLKSLAKKMLEYEMDKNWHIAASNWEKLRLSARQVDYAAKDAIVGLEIFRVFNERIEIRELGQFRDVSYKPPKIPKIDKKRKQPAEAKTKPIEPRKPQRKRRSRAYHLQTQQIQAQLYTEF